MQILSIIPPRFLHSKKYHDYANATMEVIDASAFPMPAGAQISRSSKFRHIRHHKSACFIRSSQSNKTAVSIYTTKVRETWKTALTENQRDFRHRHSDSLYSVLSDCFLQPDNHILWILATSANWIVTGVYDICQVLKGVQISLV